MPGVYRVHPRMFVAGAMFSAVIIADAIRSCGLVKYRGAARRWYPQES
jgi:hypothetical protein